MSTFRSVHAVTYPLPLCYVLSFVRSRAHPNSSSPGRYCSERIPIHRLYSLLSAIPISSVFCFFFQRFIVSSGSRVLPGSKFSNPLSSLTQTARCWAQTWAINRPQTSPCLRLTAASRAHACDHLSLRARRFVPIARPCLRCCLAVSSPSRDHACA